MFSDIIGVTSLMDDSFVHAELLFAVFTSRVSSTLATQSFGYGIWTLHGSHFIPCKVTIINLGHTGKSEYQSPSTVSVPCSSPLYHQVISTHRFHCLVYKLC
jgi:hypothetical protein